MRAAVQTAYGGPEVIVIRDVPKPVPGAGEVLVRVIATTVTSGDARLRAFRVPPAFWLPARLALGIRKPRKTVLGSEFAGEVVAVGSGVKRLRTGDRVFGMHLYDAHAEYKVVPESAAIVSIPSNLDFAEAAALPFGALTARFFIQRAGLQPGQRVLVNGASGAVGTRSVQLAKQAGAWVTAVTSTRNIELVRSLGADEVIDYQAADFSLTEQPYDVVMDTVGTVSWARFCRASTPTGQLLAIDGGGAMFLRAAWRRWIGRRRVVVGMATEKLEDIEIIRGLAESGALRATIDRRFPLADIAEAHALVDSGRKRGAVVIDVAEPQPVSE
ncbi:MAG TPA: NAD(P)-dependent alcohol dehydrogenase [Devosia sp.]|jgi:NADPH:quinone reductase-like Zn-dependent oxidoreductase|nr:NAD(P)-dependent alcohol dehydrogenase [Devosia sp.]